MGKINQSITEIIGNTPLVELVGYEKSRGLKARIIGKLEYYNPASSVKDRIAFSMIEDAEKKGLLKEGYTIIETTSGNTGIALAAIAAAKGYKLRLYLQDGVSIERTKTIKAYGAQLYYFSDVPEVARTLEETGGDFVAAIKELEKILEKEEKIFFLNQVGNPANPKIHRETTGPEIWEDTEGKVDVFVATVGTGGTVTGAGGYLKSKNPDIKIVAVQPGINSIPSPKNPHPKEITGVHKFDWIDENRVPPILDREIYDEVIDVETVQANEIVREIAREDGILLGTSSGAAVWAATQLANRPENEGKNIVAVLPDTGLRYLSTDLFED